MTNIRIILLAVFVSMMVAIIALYRNNKHLTEEYIRLKTNQKTLIKELNSRQMTLTNREFLEMYSNILQRFKELDIKSKNIENYINYKYIIKDTNISIVRIDTITKHIIFHVEKDCYNLNGEIFDDSIKTSLSVSDDIDIILYKRKNKDYSWWYRLWHKKARYVIDAAAYSNCLKDTITIKRNIRVE